MSSEYLKEVVTKEVTDVVEKIFEDLKKTVVDYQEVIYRLRRFLHVFRKAESEFNRTSI